jgi:hypothetical protein
MKIVNEGFAKIIELENELRRYKQASNTVVSHWLN